MGSGEDKAQPFRVFREAARRLREAAEKAAEAPARIVEAAPVPPRRGDAGEGPRPFRRPRRSRTPGRLRGSPLEGRAASVLVYNRPPSTRLADIIGASEARARLEKLASQGVGRVLIAGPPGVGKSVLALAYAAELDRSVIDVDAGGLAGEADAPELLNDVVEEALRGDYTLVIYNVEGLVDPSLAGKVIIYDPYTPLSGGGGRVIIYDPYTDSAEAKSADRVIIYDPYIPRGGPQGETPALVETLVSGVERGLRVVATSTSPWILPRRLRGAFEATVAAPLPGLEDRREVLENLLSRATLGNVNSDHLAALTAGASVSDLVTLSEAIAEEARRRGALGLEELARIVSGTRNTGSSIVSALYSGAGGASG